MTANPFDSFEISPTDERKVYDNKSNRNPFDEMQLEESWGKSLLRTLYQIPSGIAQAATYPLDLLSMVGHADALDPLEIERLEQISAREGIPFDTEKYLQAAEASQKYFPTQSNVERIAEEQTGAPLTPKTRFQKGLKFASTAGKIIPKSGSNLAPTGTTFRGMNIDLPRPILGAGVAATKEIAQELGAPELLSEVASFGILKSPTAGASKLSIGKSTKPSGLTERRFESVSKPTEVTKSRLGKINEAVEGDFKNITENLIKESPVKTTYNALKDDSGFKAKVAELFPQVEVLADQVPGTFSSIDIKKAIAEKYQSKEGLGLTPGEYQKNYVKFMKEFLKDTPTKEATAKDLVSQYRINNKELGEYFKPGESKAYNRARKDALLDYNKSIAELIEKKYPNSEFSELFKFSNKRWTEISDIENINRFLDDLFSGKIRYDRAGKFLENDGTNFSFKRALGDEHYSKFKQLTKDLLSQEEAYKLLSIAKKKGYSDLAKTGMAYLLHPGLAATKVAVQGGVKAAKGIYKSLLDKPKLAFVWDDALKALKKGKFAEAEIKFADLDRAIHADEILPKQGFSKNASKKTNEEILVNPIKKEMPNKLIENRSKNAEQEKLRKESLEKFNDQIKEKSKFKTEKGSIRSNDSKNNIKTQKKYSVEEIENMDYEYNPEKGRMEFKLKKTEAKIKKDAQDKKINKEVENKIEEVKRLDISPKKLREQKSHFLNALQDALENPQKSEKITIRIPEDGIFNVVNTQEAIKKVIGRVKSKWPINQSPTSKTK